MTSAEEYVHEMDEKTGASLKLSILNPKIPLPALPVCPFLVLLLTACLHTENKLKAPLTSARGM